MGAENPLDVTPGTFVSISESGMEVTKFSDPQEKSASLNFCTKITQPVKCLGLE